MIKFEYTIENLHVARQIASLLNKYNMLKKFHTEYSILDNKTEYIVNIDCIQNTFILNGCVGIEILNADTSLIKHLCVDENFRRQKIAEKLLKKALTNIKTKFILMNIRHTNRPSLALVSKLGFTVESYYKNENYFIITVKKENYVTNI
jgi:N-acetylglutamate synthase-like GNAT family acetyltransferase